MEENKKEEVKQEGSNPLEEESKKEEPIVDSKDSNPDDLNLNNEELKEVDDASDKLLKEIEDLRLEVNRLKNAYAKAYADTENVKKRLEAEAATNKKYRIQSFAKEVLPAIDNLERALSACSDESDAGLKKGIEMVYDQLIKSLKDEGVEEIDCLNKDFDPNFEQSIMVEKKDGVKSNVVIEVLQKGYMLKDRVLRAAMVKISE